jgi:aminoglycoside 3-N-acetyltransferase I
VNVEVKKLTRQDIDQFTALIRVFEDVFEMENFVMPDEAYLQNLLATDSFFVFVALSDNAVVGGLTCYILQQYYSTSPLVYIYDLAVKTDRQRRGIGKLLMSSLTSYCKNIGAEAVFVQADLEDGHALDFYRATGGTAAQTVNFDYPL